MDLDEFSDDGLDEIPDSALQELEANAIQSTQAPPAWTDTVQWVDDDDDDDLDMAEVTDNRGVPVGRPPEKPHQLTPHNRMPSGPAPQTRPAHAGLQASRAIGRPMPPPPVSGLSQRYSSQTPVRPPASQSRPPPGDIVSALQQRVRALEADLNAAKGEVSIIRTNSTKSQQQHDVEIGRLKKINAEQVAKQERLVEAAIEAEKNANTELQFLRHDIREVSDRSRRKDPGASAVTPKKAVKNWGYADGFDALEAASPSKQAKAKVGGSVAAHFGERTPTKGKRKRPMMDSPVKSLDTHMEDVVAKVQQPSSAHLEAAHPLVSTSSLPSEFLQLVLDHVCFEEQPPTFDILSRFSFPSEPNLSLAALIFQRLPLMGNIHLPTQLLVDFAHFVISIWQRCLDEELWDPIKYLVGLVAFTLHLHTNSVAPVLITSLVPVAQRTICTLAEARHRHPTGVPKNEEFALLEEHIDTFEVLSLLHLSAQASSTATLDTETGDSPSLIFWSLTSLDLPIMLLTPKQNLEDMITVLDLLALSSLPESIGPITDERDAEFVARVMVERVSSKLTDMPLLATEPLEKRQVKTAALRALIGFSRHPFGAGQLAIHDSALPRLVTCLSTSIDELYDQPIPVSIFDLDDNDPLHSTSSAELQCIISQCMLLIYKLVTDAHTANSADIAQKLSVWHGGSQRYLISLGRLTFAEEDVVMEAGIESEIVEMAHELLEMAVTPDEGETISEAFEA